MQTNYTAKDIDILKDLEPVRLRPGMYIGDVSVKGLHHLIWEVLDNSIDEHGSGYGDKIEIFFNKDENKIRITDEGRGIPVDKHEEGISAATLLLTTLHSGGKFKNKNYNFSGGLHGVGVSVVNALSEHLKLIIERDGYKYIQEFSKGKPLYELKQIEKSDRKGTSIEFVPDFSIFEENTSFEENIIIKRLEELSYLNPKLTIVFNNTKETKVLKNPNGIISFIKEKEPFTEIFNLTGEFIDKEKNNTTILYEIAFAYKDNSEKDIKSFVNNISTIEGGKHEEGFKQGLLNAITTYIADVHGINKAKNIIVSDILEGLIAVINIKMKDAMFEGQTKSKLSNSFVQSLLSKGLLKEIYKNFQSNKEKALVLLSKIIVNSENRIALQNEKKHIKTVKETTNSSITLPGKLADCQTKKAFEAEMFIVEGDSAAGNAKQGRNRYNQAILSLKGKILNIEKSTLEKLLKSEEIKNIITALGCGIKPKFNIDKLRYHKIIIMTDADVDGSHIRILLLTFFFRFMPEIIEKGYLYIANPPLYGIKDGKNIIYAIDEKELLNIIIEKMNLFKGIKKENIIKIALEDYSYGKEEEKIAEKLNISINNLKEYILSIFEKTKEKMYIQRYKGLGEMNISQLKETTLDKEKRMLTKVTIEDKEKVDQVIKDLMGDDSEPRKKMIFG